MEVSLQSYKTTTIKYNKMNSKDKVNETEVKDAKVVKKKQKVSKSYTVRAHKKNVEKLHDLKLITDEEYRQAVEIAQSDKKIYRK